MRRTSLLFSFVLSFLVPVARAVSPAAVGIPSPPNVKALVSALPSDTQPWKATLDLQTGRVRMLYNGESASSSAPLAQHARSFLKVNRLLFGISGESDLRFTRTLKHGLGETAYYLQQYGGVPLFPGEIAVSRNAKGRIYLVSSDARPDVSLDVQPAFSAKDAAARAALEAGGGKPGTPELVVWALATPYRLAWKVDVSVSVERQERVILDAHTGKLIERFNRVAAAAPKANIHVGNPISTPGTIEAPLLNLTDPTRLIGQFVEIRKFSGYDGQGNPQGATDVTSQNGNFVLPATDPKFNQPMLYYHVDRWHSYFKTTFGFTGRDARMPVYSDVTAPNGGVLNNAYFSPACNCLAFGKTSNGLDYALDADVIGHEYTHGVINAVTSDNGINNNPRWTEARAMYEAYSDYFSSTVVGDGCFAETLSGKTDGTCGRDLTNRKKYPEEVGQTVTLQNGTVITEFPQEHYTGEIWGATLWDLRRALGNQISDRVIFRSLSLLPATASFGDARVAIQTADAQLGTGGGNLIRQIFENRGIAEQRPVGYALPDHFTLNGNENIITGYVSPNGGDFTRVGFYPVFIAGRTHVVLGIMDPIENLKEVALLFLNDQNQIVSRFPASLADVKVNVPNGQISVKRFHVQARIPEDRVGNHKMAIAVSTDGQNFRFGNTIAGRVIVNSGPAPAPPVEVASTPPPLPSETPTVPPPPAQPASITVGPQGAKPFVGQEVAFSAQVVDTQNKPLPNANVTWTLTGAGANDRATISPNGILRARTAGTVTVVAAVGAVSGSAAVEILPAAVPTGVQQWQFVGGSEEANVVGLSASAANGQSAVYAASTGKVLVSRNQGAFQDITAGLDAGAVPSAVAVNPANPQSVYVATFNKGLFHSASGGTGWTQWAQGLFDPVRNANTGQPYPTLMTVETEASDAVAVGSLDQGAFVRNVNGPWVYFTGGLTFGTVRSFTQTPQGTVYAGTSAGAFRLRFAAQQWESINNGLVAQAIEGDNHGLPPYVNRVVFNPQNPNELLAATNESGVFYSSNEGNTWAPVNNGLADRTIFAVAFDPLVPGRIFCGTFNDGVYVSTDKGLNWKQARAGMPNGIVTALLFDPTLKQFLLAGTLGAGIWALDTSKSIVSEVTFLPGDVNADNKVDVTDAIVVLRSIVGLTTATPDQIQRGDMDRDSKLLVNDAVLILRKAVGL